MRLDRLTLLHFRNLRGPEPGEPLQWAPHPRFNLLVGDNGQGKTNILEAIAILGGLRSFRTARLPECVAFGQPAATLAAAATAGGVQSQLGIEIGQHGKKLRIDGKAAHAASAFAGRLTAVVFTSADLQLPHAEPEARRKWLDRVVFNHQPAHLDEVKRYDAALHAKNKLLRDHVAGKAKADPALLDVYDGLMAKHGAEIMRRRRTVVGQFSPLVSDVFARIAAPGLQADVQYRPALGHEGDETQDRLLHGQKQRRDRDLRIGYASSGPHRDDVDWRIGGMPAHLHASQGQCRALVLAGKIAEIKSLEKTLGEAPILLMDDISSELDAQRNAALMHFLDQLGGQVVLTTTAAEHVRVLAPRQLATVRAGVLEAGAVLGDATATAKGTQATLGLG